MSSPYYDEQAAMESLRQTIVSLLLIIGAILVCSVSLVAGVDAICRRDIDTWLPLYPAAEILSTDHDFFRPRAMGNTYMVLYTADAAPTVRHWYSDLRRRQTETVALDRDIALPLRTGLATIRYYVESLPAGQTGSKIYLISECAAN